MLKIVDFYQQKLTIKLHLSTLFLMDFHAHTSLMEVMGLVAGEWNATKNTLTISHYEPCRNVASSSTHCDMCPISQAKAADTIHTKNLNILGWFHSHPTFAPEPSQQDLDTQQDVQLWVGNKYPCLGVILSPFSSNGALIASPFRCMIVDRDDRRKRSEQFHYHNDDDDDNSCQLVPYKYDVELISDDFDVDCLLRDITRVFQSISRDANATKSGSQIKFNQPYFLDNTISYLEKVRVYIFELTISI